MKEFDRMLKGFHESMVFIYPDGIHNEIQFRDICRVFIMSWSENLRASIETLPKHHIPVTRLLCILEDPRQLEIAKQNWIPTEEWKYW